jgi:cytochrome c553
MNIKIVYLLALLLISGIAITSYLLTSDSDIFKSEPELIARGLYLNKCATCHGQEGEGAATFPDIRRTSYSEDQIKNLLRHGAGEMPAFPEISEPELSYLVKFVIKL